ncbi:MAG: hypothetical protein ABL932_21735, partial [Terricaulis sp.]
LRGGKIFGSYTLSAGSRFDGYATDITVDGPADANAYVDTNVIHAKGALTAKAGYDCTVSEEGFTGVTVPTISATHYRSGQAYAGAHQIRLKALDETAVLDSFRWIHNDGLPSKINTADDFGPALYAQSAFRRAFNGGPGALDQFYDLAGNLLWSVDRNGKFECCGGIIKGAVEVRSPLTFLAQIYVELKNATRSFFVQGINAGDYLRILIGYVGDGVRLYATGLVETLGAVHANAWATPPAGGSPNVCLKVAGIGWHVGTGDPTLTAAVGSKYTDVTVPCDWKMTATGWSLA